MPFTHAPFWTKAPALRLLLPFMVGIVVQWYAQLPLPVLITTGGVLVIAALVYGLLPVHRKYRFASLNGMVLHLLIASIGSGLVYANDIRNDSQWFGHKHTHSTHLFVTLQEPLVDKPNSLKALAHVERMYSNDSSSSCTGTILLYFQKDSAFASLGYGSQILIRRPLQQVRNTGNPGAFDYQRYNLFQGITHQAYLTPKDCTLLPHKKQNAFKAFLFTSRHAIIRLLQTYLPGEKEQGLAEALLIGYKDDLNKTLLQAYANTGVVHVIAISGLHLALIYGLLLALTRPLKRKQTLWLRLLLIVAGLWLFSLLAGAQPSVMRSCVMFSFIAVAEVLDRRTSILNTLALSAFLLLCVNPFWLWDIGFQLSYAAVLSLVLFYGPIYRWVYLQNKTLDLVWKLVAVTLAAQILTLPISLYHFHQFPLLFLLTNVVAVPLSSLILIGLIALCATAFLPPLAAALGNALNHAIRWLNDYIERFEGVSFVVWDGISISVLQTMLLTAVIAATAYWLMEKNKRALTLATLCAACFLALRSYSIWQASGQQKLIVYNVPKHPAMDIIEGTTCHYIGSPELLHNDQLHRFFIQPSRTLHRAEPAGNKPALSKSFRWHHQRILVLDSTVQLALNTSSPVVDLLILSQNPKVYIRSLAKAFHLKQVVADGSVPRWKARLWKRDCDSLHIPFHDVSEKGAFILSL